MAKAKRTKKAKKVVRAKVVRKVVAKPANGNKRMMVLLALLAVSILILAAMSMAKAGI